MSFNSVFNFLKENNLKIAFAESITGGKLSSEFVSNPGASSCFELGLVTYSNLMKEKYLNIPISLIDKFGAVSKEVSNLMALNIKKIANSDIGVGITGNAGPASQDKSAVGDVWLSIVAKEKLYSYKLNIKGDDRNSIINNAAQKTWEILLRILNNL